MPINKDTLYFFRLIRSGAGLGAAPVSDTADTAVTPGSWERIYRMAADHGLSAVVWDGICRLPAAQQPPRETRIRWALSAEKLEERYRHQQQTASKLAARFSEEGLRMLLLKGLGLSRDYPLPEHRECGDIDIYLYGQSDKGDRVLHEIGAHLYFDVPKHSEYVWDGVLIENHRTILNVRRNRTERELNAVLVRLLEKEGTHGLAPGIQAPRATFNAIFLIRHAAVHFQKEGIVLRHLCDWACFLTRHWDEIDHALFRTAMEDYRMDRFADLMTAAAVEYLGRRFRARNAKRGCSDGSWRRYSPCRRCRTSPCRACCANCPARTGTAGGCAKCSGHPYGGIITIRCAASGTRNSPYSGSRRPQAPEFPAESAPGESWPRKDKNNHDPGKSFAGYFGFKNKELYLHRKTTQGIRYLVRIGKK